MSGIYQRGRVTLGYRSFSYQNWQIDVKSIFGLKMYLKKNGGGMSL